MKLKPLTYHPEAIYELGTALDYFHDQGQLEEADELQSELLQSLHDLQTDPDLHPEVAPGLRAWRPTKKYKWRIGYAERAGDIVILAAYYAGEEDPLYWLDRELP